MPGVCDWCCRRWLSLISVERTNTINYFSVVTEYDSPLETTIILPLTSVP
jgi:hypothetical protein